MNHALFGSFIQHADGFQNSIFGFGIAFCKGGACGVYSGAGSTTECTIANAALFVLTIAFDLRLNVSQGRFSKNSFLTFLIDSAVFYMSGGDLSSNLMKIPQAICLRDFLVS